MREKQRVRKERSHASSRRRGFFPFLVVRSDFRFLVIPSGCYWVPLDKKEEGGGRTRMFHLNNKKNYAILSSFVS